MLQNPEKENLIQNVQALHSLTEEKQNWTSHIA